jgi:MFS family permease
MNKRQLVALFLAGFAGYVVPAGALPLLPVYAVELGAPPVLTGYYLAFAYLALTAGSLAGGWLSDRCRRLHFAGRHRGRRRALLALLGVLAAPATWSMGRSGGVQALTLSTAVAWFLSGSGRALTSILAGILARTDERGKVYGLLSLAGGVGSLLGGLITGPLADRWGYRAMFALLALFYALWPLAALVLRDKRADQGSAGRRQGPGERSVAGKRPVAGRGLRLGKSFYLLFAASLVAASAVFLGLLGRSLSMNALGYPAAAISSTVAVSNLLALPLPLLLGWLSDRCRRTDRGRKLLLALGYLLASLGLVGLSLSSSLWHFWIAAALITLSYRVSSGIGPALANDLIPRASLDRGLGLFGATLSIGAIVGFAGTGQAVQHLGLRPTTIGGAALPLIAICLLALVRPAKDAADGPADK